jgi:transposase
MQTMKRLQAYKFQSEPNGEQQRNLRYFAGSCRFVYNKALALQKENHESGKPFIGYVAMAKQHGNAVAPRFALPSLAANLERFGTRLPKRF